MAKQTFNEAESFLLDSWEKAREFEEAMASVRQKYRVVAQRIIDAAGLHESKFDYCHEFVANDMDGGGVAFGRRDWVTGDKEYVAGLWVCGIGLDSLLSPSSEDPWVSVWSRSRFVSREEAAKARREVWPQLEKLVTPERCKMIKGLEEDSRSLRTIMWWNFSSKQELLAALREGNSEKFEEIIMDELDAFSAMLPALDPILIRMKARK